MSVKFGKIKKINNVGEKDIYHLSVNKNKNFFGNNICLHNCGYRGEVKIILVNLSNDDFTVEHGDRIAQGVLANVSGQRIVNLMKVDTINKDTDRAEGGFGSTGTK